MLTRFNNPHNPINAAAAKRILGIPSSTRIEFLEVSSDAVSVRYTRKGSTQEVVLTRAQFEAEFVNYRREGAKECIAEPHSRGPWGEIYRVTGSKGDRYYVEAGDRLACTCEDWHTHEAVCKHGYAVLNLLGLSTFEQYRQARKKVVYPSVSAQRIGGRLCVNGVGIE